MFSPALVLFEFRSPCGSWQSQQKWPPMVATVCLFPSCAASATLAFLSAAAPPASGSTPKSPVEWQLRHGAFGAVTASYAAKVVPPVSDLPLRRNGLDESE